MKKGTILAVLLSLAFASVGAPREVAGVQMPDTLTLDGKSLRLNGMGLRTRIVKVYVAGLYLEKPSSEASTVVSSDQVKRVELRMLRGLGRSRITEAISEGFEKNSEREMPALKARLDRFNAMIPDLEKADSLFFTYFPGKGTVVSVKGAEKGVIEGKDFADALFSVWLGPNPVQQDLKKALLGS